MIKCREGKGTGKGEPAKWRSRGACIDTQRCLAAMGRHVEQKSPLWHVKIMPPGQNLEMGALNTRPMVAAMQSVPAGIAKSELELRASSQMANLSNLNKKKLSYRDNIFLRHFSLIEFPPAPDSFINQA